MLKAFANSLQNIFEAVAESIGVKFSKLSRIAILVILGIICLGTGINMETIFKWGPWVDIVSIYIISLGATLGAISWFWIMKKQCLLDEINKSVFKPHGNLWYYAGKFLYVPCAVILCCIALFMKVAF